jgi:type II secretory pathway predicted ATPase ExeA
MESEEDFLNKIAKSIGLKGKPLEVFRVCFSSHHKNLDDPTLASKIWGSGEINEPVKTMLTHLTTIYRLVEQDLGCPATGNGKQGRSEGNSRKINHYYEWIWDVKYPEYLAADRSTIAESSSGNPFSDRVRIEDPNRFFGRTEFLRRLQEDLQKGMSLALVGETKIGKSSILQYLYRRGKHQWRGKQSKFVYIDMQVINHDEDFQSELCHQFGIESACSMAQLDRELKRRGQKYILCLDELEMLSHDKFSFQVRSNLCGLANGDSTPLILVTATRSPLNVIFPDRPNETSPLASLCQQRNVLPFDKQETLDFIHMRLEGTGVTFSDRDIAELYQQTNGHPGQLQQAAADLFDRVASALPNRSTDSQAT